MQESLRIIGPNLNDVRRGIVTEPDTPLGGQRCLAEHPHDTDTIVKPLWDQEHMNFIARPGTCEALSGQVMTGPVTVMTCIQASRLLKEHLPCTKVSDVRSTIVESFVNLSEGLSE